MNIYKIIERKKNGIDCTESESAEIKGWLRYNERLSSELSNRRNDTLYFIIDLFPLEYGEYAESRGIEY